MQNEADFLAELIIEGWWTTKLYFRTNLKFDLFLLLFYSCCLIKAKYLYMSNYYFIARDREQIDACYSQGETHIYLKALNSVLQVYFLRQWPLHYLNTIKALAVQTQDELLKYTTSNRKIYRTYTFKYWHFLKLLTMVTYQGPLTFQ